MRPLLLLLLELLLLIPKHMVKEPKLRRHHRRHPQTYKREHRRVQHGEGRRQKACGARGDATCPITRHVLARSHRSGAKLLDFTFCPRRAEMDAHVLKTLLQIHLASDASATLHVPYILATLEPEHLAPSSHLSKWTNRIHSLLHSKEPGGRWAGLSLAMTSARLSRSFMIDCAQDWLTVSFALLSVCTIMNYV